MPMPYKILRFLSSIKFPNTSGIVFSLLPKFENYTGSYQQKDFMKKFQLKGNYIQAQDLLFQC